MFNRIKYNEMFSSGRNTEVYKSIFASRYYIIAYHKLYLPNLDSLLLHHIFIEIMIFKTKKIFALMFTVFIVILTIFSNDVQKVVASSKHRIIRRIFQWTDTFTLVLSINYFQKF